MAGRLRRSSAWTTRAGSSSWRRCSVARRPVDPPPWPARASCSTAPMRGAARSHAHPDDGRAADEMVDLDRAIDSYLTYLDVERGLSPATIRAYRGDLSDFGAARDVAAGWDRSADAAVSYLAARTRRGRRTDPGLAPSSLRRRAASLKGF